MKKLPFFALYFLIYFSIQIYGQKYLKFQLFTVIFVIEKGDFGHSEPYVFKTCRRGFIGMQDRGHSLCFLGRFSSE